MAKKDIIDVPIIEREPTAEELAWAEQEILDFAERKIKAVQDMRRSEYQLKADPLFFGWQRGDNSKQDWLDAIQNIRDSYPYPDAV